MTLHARVLSERVDAAPGELATVHVAFRNDGAADARVHVVVVGLAGTPSANGATLPPPAGPPGADDVTIAVAANTETTALVPVLVPAALGVGEHAAALEVRSDRPGHRPTLVPFTVSVASVDRVELTPVPPTIRGRRRGKLRVDVANFEPAPVEVEVHGESPDAMVRFRRPLLHLLSGQRALVTGSVKGPRRWSGEPIQHTVVITGRGRASSTPTATAIFVQRPWFARRMRTGVAMLVVIALWLGALGGLVWWWHERGDDEQAGDGTAQAIDTDGDGVPDLFVTADGEEIRGIDTDGDGVIDTLVTADGQRITAVDTDGDGEPDAFFDAAGNPVADPRGSGGGGGRGGGSGEVAGGAGGSGGGAAGGQGGGGAAAPVSAVVRGTVNAAGSLDDISITLTPISLAGPRPAAADAAGPQALVGSGPGTGARVGPVDGTTTPDRPPAKFWSARLGAPTQPHADAISAPRQSEPLAPMVTPMTTNPQADGVWLFTDVALRQSYELVFSKPGFDTQSFVVTPPDDGTAVEMDVELEPAKGALSGTVRGPNGPLGGVKITVTDGTLEFTTTSATVGQVGTWSIENVSTPAVYTITGVRSGYGTEVRQVELAPGEERAGADLTMRPGVGSVAGRVVGSDGQPLGAVKITARHGEDQHTTSTLTEGDVGFFLLPQITAPADYTLTVELPGYVTQTRRVSVNGAVGGVNFTLIPTTQRLTGLVTSARDGSGVANAGLTLSTGDLTFKVATAGGAAAGTFAIDDLPPGNYTVRVEHYQHQTSTQFVTLTAGVAPPPLNIELAASDGIAGVGTGSLVVEVIDPAAETSEDREVQDATVRLVAIPSGDLVRELTQEAFDFELENVPVGTYTLLVTAPRYNPAPPRRVSIGLSQTRVQVDMQRLGQASGRVVDSITGEVLTDYFVSLYRQPENPDDPPVFPPIAARADGTWQTPANSMIPGVYRVAISDSASPAGYVVRDDQILDPEVPGATPADRFMRFQLTPDQIDPVVVADIEADRLPVLSGRVYRPAIDRSLPSSGPRTALLPVDAPSLTVTVTCSDATEPYTATVLDVSGVVSGDQYDSFTIDPLEVDAGNLTGDCEVTATADGYEPATATLANVDASDGNTLSDRRVHLSVAPPAPDIGGTVFWRDGGTVVPLGGVSVSADVVTAFPPREADAENAPPTPTLSPRATTSTDPAGEWQLNGQRFGVSAYTFAAPGFATAAVELTVDGTGVRATAMDQAIVDSPAPGRFDVELASPDPQTLTGTLTVHTSDTPVDFDLFTLSATAPDGTAISEGPNGSCPTDATVTEIRRIREVGTVLEFEICNALPGTWNVTVDEPDHFDYHGATPPLTELVQPAAAPPVFPLELRQLGAFELTLLDSGGDPLDLPAGVEPTITLTGPSLPTTPMVVSGPTDNVFTQHDLAVDVVDPVGTAVNYTLSVSVPGYDVASAEVAAGPAPNADGTFPLQIVAGATIELELELPAYGSITGSVEGDLGPFIAAPEMIDMADGTITATPVDAAGTAVGAPIDVTPTSGNTFTIVGPPGYYLIEVSHPNFADGTPPADEGQFDSPVIAPPAVHAQVGVYRLVNERVHTLDPFVLDIRPGRVDLTVVTQLDGAPTSCEGSASPLCVPDARYELVPSGRAEGAPGNIVGTVTGGHASIGDVPPDTYTLYVRQFDGAGLEVAFPAILTITIGRSQPGLEAVTTVRAPLPALVPSVSGDIVAVNQQGRDVAFPTGLTFAVSSDFAAPDIEVTGRGFPTPGTAPETTAASGPSLAVGDRTATIDATDAANGSVTYTLPNMAVGAHAVTLDSPLPSNPALVGFTGPADTTVNHPVTVAAGPQTNGPDFTFTAKDVTARAVLGDDDEEVFEITSASLTWDDPADADTAPNVTYTTYTFDEDTHTIDFPGVLPEVGDFTLTVEAVLHDTLVATVQVPPASSGDLVVTLDVPAMTATLGRVEGTVQQQGASGTVNLQAGGVVRLLDAAGGTVVDCAVGGATEPCSTTAGVDGLAEYSFDVPSGSYWLEVTQTDFPTYSVAVEVTDGKVTSQPVLISQLATYTVTLANGATLNTPVVRLVGEDMHTPTTVEGQTYTFKAPAGDYSLTVSAQNYRQTTVVDHIELERGEQEVAAPVNLPRYLTVTVSSGGTGTLTGVTMTVYKSSAPGTQIGDPFTINTGNALIRLPAELANDTADIDLQFAHGDYRTRRIKNVAFALDSTQSPALYPLFDMETGTITGLPDLQDRDQYLQAVPDGGGPAVNGTITCSATGTCNYIFQNLGTTSTGGDQTWKIVYDELGAGYAEGSIVVTAIGQGTVPNLVIAPRNVAVAFQVNGADGGLDGATVTIGTGDDCVTDGVDGTTDGDGKVTLQVPEDEYADLCYSVEADGYQTKKVDALPTLDGLDIIVPVVTLDPETPPDTTEPDTTEPDTTEPDTTEPDTTEPDTTEPDP